MLSHFLIHVEYRSSTTMDLNIEVMHKKSVTEIKTFIEKERNNIVKYLCKSESEFKSFLNEQKEFVAAERRESRNIGRSVRPECFTFQIMSNYVRIAQFRRRFWHLHLQQASIILKKWVQIMAAHLKCCSVRLQWCHREKQPLQNPQAYVILSNWFLSHLLSYHLDISCKCSVKLTQSVVLCWCSATAAWKSSKSELYDYNVIVWILTVGVTARCRWRISITSSKLLNRVLQFMTDSTGTVRVSVVWRCPFWSSICSKKWQPTNSKVFNVKEK